MRRIDLKIIVEDHMLDKITQIIMQGIVHYNNINERLHCGMCSRVLQEENAYVDLLCTCYKFKQDGFRYMDAISVLKMILNTPFFFIAGYDRYLYLYGEVRYSSLTLLLIAMAVLFV